MDYKETIEYLYHALPVFQRVGASAYKANLNNTLALDEYLGHPHRKYLTIHVAGTNGKGSVSHMLASVLIEAGYKTGLYTSPHLLDFRERIRINGELISEEEVVCFVNNHKRKIEEIRPSFFELTVAMAFYYFAEQEVDIAVVEVGMGGRLDSTNIVKPVVSVITNISHDHNQFLGQTLAEIAAEKAGIIKPGVPVVIGETDPETRKVFEKIAAEKNSPLVFADQQYSVVAVGQTDSGQEFQIRKNDSGEDDVYELDLAGSYQQKNVITLLAVTELVSCSSEVVLNKDIVQNGLRHAARSTGLKGRWHKLGDEPLIIADTGHNEAGLREVVRQLSKITYNKLFVVIGVVNDKDTDSLWRILPADAYYIFTRANIERALGAELLADSAKPYGIFGEVISEVPVALKRARELAGPDDLIFVGGSTFTVAEIISV